MKWYQVPGFVLRFSWFMARVAWKSLRTPGFFGQLRAETHRQAEQLRRWKAEQVGGR